MAKWNDGGNFWISTFVVRKNSNPRFCNPNQMLFVPLVDLFLEYLAMFWGVGHILAPLVAKNARHLWIKKILRSSGHDELQKGNPPWMPGERNWGNRIVNVKELCIWNAYANHKIEFANHVWEEVLLVLESFHCLRLLTSIIIWLEELRLLNWQNPFFVLSSF